MQDYLIRGTAYEEKVRFFAALTTGLVEELRRRHDTWPTATAALGRAATAGVMMGAMLKGEEKLTIQIKGNGPLGQIVIDANASGEVRGYVDNPHVHLPLNFAGKLDVAGAVGHEGTIYVIKDLGMKEPYRGSIPIISGELGEDFTYYFVKSEQTPSAVAIGVLVDTDTSVITAGGFIIQLLPGLPEEEITRIEQEIGGLSSITSLLEQGENLERIMNRLIGPLHNLERADIRFSCKCSVERVEQMLFSLGKADLEEMKRENGGAEVVCHFCNETYTFLQEDLERMIAKT